MLCRDNVGDWLLLIAEILLTGPQSSASFGVSVRDTFGAVAPTVWVTTPPLQTNVLGFAKSGDLGEMCAESDAIYEKSIGRINSYL